MTKQSCTYGGVKTKEKRDVGENNPKNLLKFPLKLKPQLFCLSPWWLYTRLAVALSVCHSGDWHSFLNYSSTVDSVILLSTRYSWNIKCYNLKHLNVPTDAHETKSIQGTKEIRCSSGSHALQNCPRRMQIG